MPDPATVRVGILLLSQATAPESDEDNLLRGDVVAYRPAPSSNPHSNSTNVADLRGGMRSFHKPLAGVDRQLARLYGHDQIAVGLNECAAWRLARMIGPPFSLMTPPTVLRWHAADAATKLTHRAVADGWGSLAREHPGRSLDLAPQHDPEICDAAAFFDALIAQQDRHAGQYRWDATSRRLGLIDHGFAFARPGDLLNQSVFLARRQAEGRGRLTAAERAALDMLDRSRHLGGLRQILAPDQADALSNRIRKMLAQDRLITPGDW